MKPVKAQDSKDIVIRPSASTERPSVVATFKSDEGEAPPAPQTGEPLQALIATWLEEAGPMPAGGWDGDDEGYSAALMRCAMDLREALAGSPALAQPRWQPIETAPKDGTEILLSDGTYKRTGYWAKRRECWSVDTVVQLPMPTHWLALPQAALAQPRTNDETKT